MAETGTADGIRSEVADKGPCEKVVSIEVPADRVNAALQDAYARLSRSARIKGFRAGKAPLSILRSRFRKDIETEVAEQLIREAYPVALEQNGLVPLSQGRVESDGIAEGSPFRFKATVEIPPAIVLGKYRGLSVTRKIREITPDDVESALASLQERFARTVARPDATVGDNTLVTITYRSPDREKQRDENASQKPRTITFRTGRKEIFPELERALLGARQGETRTGTIAYPSNHPDSALAGKTAAVVMEVAEIKGVLLPPLDDELARDAGEKDLAALRKKAMAELQTAAEARATAAAKEELVSAGRKASDVPAPPRLVQQRFEEDKRRYEENLSLLGGTLSESEREDALQTLQSRAEQKVKDYFFLKAVAEKEGLQPTEEDVEARLRQDAVRMGREPEALRKVYEERNLLPEVREAILLGKAADLLYTHARVGTLYVGPEEKDKETEKQKSASRLYKP